MAASKPTVTFQGQMVNATPGAALYFTRPTWMTTGGGLGLRAPSVPSNMAWDIIAMLVRGLAGATGIHNSPEINASSAVPFGSTTQSPGASEPAEATAPPSSRKVLQAVAPTKRSDRDWSVSNVRAEDHAVVFNGQIAKFSENPSCLPEKMKHDHLVATGFSLMFNAPIDADAQGIIQVIQGNKKNEGE